MDAKLDVRFVLMILNTFESFLLQSASFLELFGFVISVCSEGVCGVLCGQT